MAVNLTSPITGAAQTGFTSPTYTLTAMAGPDVNVKQNAVTAIGGTQTGVTVHSVSSPFTLSFWYPKVLKILPFIGSTSALGSVPVNSYKLITRKGVTPMANQAARTMRISTTVEVPAGADTYDSANVRAALSVHIGALAQQSAGFGDTGVSGVA